MIPVVTPDEMGAIDRAAPEPVAVLIGRAGGAVARAAVEMLGGTYGRRVVVLAGKGNNGNDGREAARRLRARGVSVVEIDALTFPDRLPDADLVIDAAFGTGFRGEYRAPELADPSTPVLAVDIPSGIQGLTGESAGRVLSADRTVTFAALKPGLLLHPGASFAGRIDVADIGLDVSSARGHLVDADDVASWLPARAAEAHKWQSAVCIVAGSPGMAGAAALCSGGAQRTGAGYVRLVTPGGLASGVPVEVVQVAPSSTVGPHGVPTGWSGPVVDGLTRFQALTIGNGLGTDPATGEEIRAVIGAARLPTVIDADAITALAGGPTPELGANAVLTPHDGEFARLAGSAPGSDRTAAAHALADRLGAVVLLKGSLTIVAHPDGRVLYSNTGDARLATAGTGDVLTGIIGALCATGVEPFRAAAAGAFLHGRAGALGWRRGLVAGDLVANLPRALDELGIV